jgi:hypothetical protein
MISKHRLPANKNECDMCTHSKVELPYRALFLYRYCVEKSRFLIHVARHDNERTILNYINEAVINQSQPEFVYSRYNLF